MGFSNNKVQAGSIVTVYDEWLERYSGKYRACRIATNKDWAEIRNTRAYAGEHWVVRNFEDGQLYIVYTEDLKVIVK